MCSRGPGSYTGPERRGRKAYVRPRRRARAWPMFRSPFPDVEIPDVSLPEFVLARAGQLGEKPALIDAPSGRTLTYAELVAGVRAVAGELARRGFGKGHVLAHYAPNLPEYAVTFFAVAS